MFNFGYCWCVLSVFFNDNLFNGVVEFNFIYKRMVLLKCIFGYFIVFCVMVLFLIFNIILFGVEIRKYYKIVKIYIF